MPNQSLQLNHIFQALADPTRRAVLQHLSSGPASTSELAQPFAMALPSFSQHLAMLENCGLVHSRKTGRTRVYRLATRPLKAAETWLTRQRQSWESRLDRLDNYLNELKDSP